MAPPSFIDELLREYTHTDTTARLVLFTQNARHSGLKPLNCALLILTNVLNHFRISRQGTVFEKVQHFS